MMEMKASKTTSWDAVHTPPWEQQKKDKSLLDLKGQSQMYLINPKTKRWRTPNLVLQAKEKTFETK